MFVALTAILFGLTEPGLGHYEPNFRVRLVEAVRESGVKYATLDVAANRYALRGDLLNGARFEYEFAPDPGNVILTDLLLTLEPGDYALVARPWIMRFGNNARPTVYGSGGPVLVRFTLEKGEAAEALCAARGEPDCAVQVMNTADWIEFAL